MNKLSAVKLLKKIKSIAEDSSLTGALADGDIMLKKTYAQIRETAISENWTENPELIPELTEDMFGENTEGMDIIGTAAALFIALLE
jgi:hypothetical protein